MALHGAHAASSGHGTTCKCGCCFPGYVCVKESAGRVRAVVQKSSFRQLSARARRRGRLPPCTVTAHRAASPTWQRLHVEVLQHRISAPPFGAQSKYVGPWQSSAIRVSASRLGSTVPTLYSQSKFSLVVCVTSLVTAGCSAFHCCLHGAAISHERADGTFLRVHKAVNCGLCIGCDVKPQ